MAKVDVILTSSIPGLGAESDQIKVALGYARNYLFPQHLAIPLTGANKRRIEVLRKRRAEREAHDLNIMSELGKMLSKLTLVITVKTGEEDKMYGSVTAATISDELKHQYDISLDKKKIHLEKPIRNVGDYDVEMRLHHDVVATLKCRVESSTPRPKPEPPPAPKVKEEPEAKTGARKPRPKSDTAKDSPRRKRTTTKTTKAE